MTIRELRELGYHQIADRALQNQFSHNRFMNEYGNLSHPSETFKWRDTNEGDLFWRMVSKKDFIQLYRTYFDILPDLFHHAEELTVLVMEIEELLKKLEIKYSRP